MEDLKPCPFCGGSAELYHDRRESGTDSVWLAYCEKCYAQGPEHARRDEAARAWNRRV